MVGLSSVYYIGSIVLFVSSIVYSSSVSSTIVFILPISDSALIPSNYLRVFAIKGPETFKSWFIIDSYYFFIIGSASLLLSYIIVFEIYIFLLI